MHSTLLEIVARRHEDIKKMYADKGFLFYKEQALVAPARYSFKAAIEGKDKLSLIAEVKKASPSRGVLRQDFDHRAIAKEYVLHGAQALSILTEPHFFLGSMTYLHDIAQEVVLPLLCKDFILDEIQIYEAKAAGASAILLIAALLSLDELRGLLKIARSLGLDVLVEVHDEQELGMVLHTSADIIGVNNRNLHDFSVDVGTTARLLPLIPPQKIIVAESGIFTHTDIPLGVDAALIGEGLIKNKQLFPQ